MHLINTDDRTCYFSKKRNDASSNGLAVEINNEIVYNNNTLSDNWNNTTLHFIAQNQTKLSFEETQTSDIIGHFLIM